LKNLAENFVSCSQLLLRRRRKELQLLINMRVNSLVAKYELIFRSQTISSFDIFLKYSCKEWNRKTSSFVVEQERRFLKIKFIQGNKNPVQPDKDRHARSISRIWGPFFKHTQKKKKIDSQIVPNTIEFRSFSFDRKKTEKKFNFLIFELIPLFHDGHADCIPLYRKHLTMSSRLIL
jgi:hypothetical protein